MRRARRAIDSRRAFRFRSAMEPPANDPDIPLTWRLAEVIVFGSDGSETKRRPTAEDRAQGAWAMRGRVGFGRRDEQ